MALIEEAHKAAHLLLDHAYVRIVAREDPDAICAAALLAHALRRENVDFHLTTLPRLDDVACRALTDEGNEGIVLLGLSGDAEGTAPAGRKVVIDKTPATLEGEAVLDPVKLPERTPETQLAPLAYYAALAMSKRNRDLGILAVAGALADHLHAPGFHGVAADVLAQGTESGMLLSESALALHGPTMEAALAQLDTPFVSGVTGRARNVKKLLSEIHLSPDAPPTSLSNDDAPRLGSFLALRLLAQGAPDEALGALFRPDIRALAGPHAGLDAASLARHAEAACAAGKGGLAFTAVWPEAAAGPEALEAHAQLRDEMVASLLRADRERGTGRVLLIDSPRRGASMPLATRIATSVLAPGRVAVARHAHEGGATLALRSWSADVGKAARHAAESTGTRVHATRTSARAVVDDDSRFLKAFEEGLA